MSNEKVSITNHFHAPIGQQIDHVDVINAYFDKDMRMVVSMKPAPSAPAETANPNPLQTTEAQAMLRKLRDAGLLDENNQPRCTRTQAALIAAELSDRLLLSPRWKPFEQLWNIDQLRTYYDKALNQTNSLAFQDHVKQLLP